MSPAGFTRPGLNCKHEDCRKKFSLYQARPDVDNYEELPDPFSAKCPHCGREAAYIKADIGRLMSLGSD